MRLNRTFAAIAVALVALLVSAACSSAPAGGANGPADTTVKSKPIDVNATYAPGVPPMSRLYASTETAPPTTAPAPRRGAKVWWLSCGESVLGCSAPGVSAREAAAALGFDFNLVDGKLNVGGGWSEGIRTAVAAGADAIVAFGISCEAASQAVKDARDRGIPVLSVEGDDCAYNGTSPNPAVAQFTDQFYSQSMPGAVSGGFWGAYGAIAADYIINRTQGQARVLMNSGVETQTKAIDDGFRREFAKCTTCQIVDTINYASPDEGPNGAWIQTFRSNIVKNKGRINAVYFPFDGFATTWGGQRALQTAGMSDQVISFGGQGFPETEESVRQGGLTAITSARPAAWVGYAAMDQINRALNNQPRVPEGFGFTLLDQTRNLPPAGTDWNGTVDWKNTYLKSWGVQP